MLQDEDEPDVDDGFGPGSDLVLSFLGVVLLLIGITIVTGLPKPNAPLPDEHPIESIAQLKNLLTLQKAQVTQAAREQERLVAKLKNLQHDLLDSRQRADRAERELKDATNRLKQSQTQAPPPGTRPLRPQVSPRCVSLLQRSSAGDPLTPAEQTELRKCL